MMKPMEAVGSVPQPGVNPAAARPAAPPQGGQQGQGVTEDELRILRGDYDVIDVFARVSGIPADMFPIDQVDPQSLAIVAGMVHKLGVDGAVAAIDKMLTPEQKAQMQAEVASQGGGAPQQPSMGGGVL